MTWIRIKAKFNSQCSKCGLEVNTGDDILWWKGFGAKHIDCDVYAVQKDDTNLLILEKEDQERLGLDLDININKPERQF